MTDHRLPRSCRICRRRDFQVVFDHGIRFSTPHLRAVVHEADREASRIGLAVSRKVGNAVVRNRLKRRLREIFRTERECAPELRDVVFIPRPGCADLSFSDLRSEVVDLLSRRIHRKNETP
ncbi:MAG: ribonuclease P protein component [Planctomycetota bacterium]|nr:ribonuclease P protein component [Planctomycetota bacterium]